MTKNLYIERIDRVSRLRDYGVFHDATWPANLPDFKRFNLIYGWNGSGKTTLSRLFQALEERRQPSMGQATVRIGGTDVRQDDFPHATLPVRVFNRDFVAKSVFPIGGKEVPPIFVVGKESVEKQKEADRYKAEFMTAESSLATVRSKKQLADGNIDKFCQDRAKAVKDLLRSPGANSYNNYDKSNFDREANQMAAAGDVASHRLSDEVRGGLLSQIRSSPKPKVQEVAYHLPALQQLADAAAQLLSTTVVSAAIKALKDDPDIADWTRHGLGLHRDRTGNKCLFCGQPLPPSRVAALEAHFSAEYEEFLGRLKDQIEGLESASKMALELVLPKRAELYDQLEQEYGNSEQGLRRVMTTVGELLDGLVLVLKQKKDRPFDRLSLDVDIPLVATDVVDRLNEVIRRHNQTCDDFDSGIAGARGRLALDMIAEGMAEFVRLRATGREAREAIAPAQQEVDRLTREIERLEREIVEHRQPAEELNDDLQKYLGHGELQMAIKDNGYSITRNGEPAQMLSEGEMTAIALLYFLKSLNDRGFDLRRGVIVLDDPVSSLDQNALFAAFGYIRDRAQAASQVIVLTHNFMFFRLVREWFDNLRGRDKRDQEFYMLECVYDGTCRRARIRAIDPLLMDYDSEYHYLFARVYKMATDAPAETLEAYYHAPSIARRVVETFVAFRVPDLGGRNRLWSRMQTIQFDDRKKSRIYRFLQTHSHRDVIGDGDEDLTLLGESRAVLIDMLDFMRAADADHVSRMITRVSTAAGAAAEGT